MKKIFYLLTITFTIFLSSCNSCNTNEVKYTRISPAAKPGVYVFSYQGHEYITTSGINPTIIHSESCPCKCKTNNHEMED